MQPNDIRSKLFSDSFSPIFASFSAIDRKHTARHCSVDREFDSAKKKAPYVFDG
jgi:hypothetical protein